MQALCSLSLNNLIRAITANIKKETRVCGANHCAAATVLNRWLDGCKGLSCFNLKCRLVKHDARGVVLADLIRALREPQDLTPSILNPTTDLQLPTAGLTKRELDSAVVAKEGRLVFADECCPFHQFRCLGAVIGLKNVLATLMKKRIPREQCHRGPGSHHVTRLLPRQHGLFEPSVDDGRKVGEQSEGPSGGEFLHVLWAATVRGKSIETVGNPIMAMSASVHRVGILSENVWDGIVAGGIKPIHCVLGAAVELDFAKKTQEAISAASGKLGDGGEKGFGDFQLRHISLLSSILTVSASS